jgi:hypothetical protein
MVAGLVASALGVGVTVAVKRALAPSPPPREARVPTAPKPVVPSVEAPGEVRVEQREVDEAPLDVEPRAPVVSPRPPSRAPVPPVVKTEPQPVAPEGTPDVPEARPAPPVQRQPQQPVVDSTAAQVAALSAAVEALERHQPELARVTARDARLADRSGVLVPELMVVEITALCDLGQHEEAQALARQMTATEQTPLVRGKLGRTCVGRGP